MLLLLLKVSFSAQPLVFGQSALEQPTFHVWAPEATGKQRGKWKTGGGKKTNNLARLVNLLTCYRVGLVAAIWAHHWLYI